MKELLLIIFCFGVLRANAQTKVASYSFGKPGTDNYENFSFWTKDGKRTLLEYSYSKNRREVKLKYIGRDTLNGKPCFKIQFSNGYILLVTLKGIKLNITDAKGKYNKIFEWEYEGPVNGIGTYCDVCAHDEEEAMQIIVLAYMK